MIKELILLEKYLNLLTNFVKNFHCVYHLHFSGQIEIVNNSMKIKSQFENLTETFSFPFQRHFHPFF